MRIVLAVALLALVFSCTPPAARGGDHGSSTFACDIVEGPVPWTHLGFHNDPDEFQFAVVSDRSGGTRPGIFEDAVGKLNLLRPEFVISVGDFVHGYTADTAVMSREWEEFTALSGGFTMPFFMVNGNHDIGNAAMRDYYIKRFGNPYYHFVYKNVLFLILDSQAALKASSQAALFDAQYDYVKTVLEANRDVRWTMVFFHQPMWQRKDNGRWPDVERLLSARNHTVIAGHTHHLAKNTREHGHSYYVLSTTGGSSMLRGPIFGEFDHALWITMTPAGPLLANLMLDGIHGDDPVDPVAVQSIRTLLKEGGVRAEPWRIEGDSFERGEVPLVVRNPSLRPVRVEIRPDYNRGLWITPAALSCRLEPGEQCTLSAVVEAPVALPPEKVPSLHFDYSMFVPAKDGKEVEQAAHLLVPRRADWTLRRAAGPITVDGKLDEWEKPAVEVDRPDKIGFNAQTWTGPGDCRYAFDLCYDSAFLYFGVRVWDDKVLVQTSDTASGGAWWNRLTLPWWQDGIEVRIDARADPERSEGVGKNEFRDFALFAMCPGTAPESTMVARIDTLPLPEGSVCACVKAEGGYCAEVAVPLAWIVARQGKEWDAVRVNVAVGDFDTRLADQSEGAHLQWRPDWRTAESFAGSGTFRRVR